MKTKKRNLDIARKAQRDEFYTQMVDIENELNNYKQYFKDKIVYCNCDGPKSNFVKYFSVHNQEFGLKDLIFTSDDWKTHVKEFKAADLIITNPPWSKATDFYEWLKAFRKKFIILCNVNMLQYKLPSFDYLAGKLDIGFHWLEPMIFEIPLEYPYGKIVDGKRYGKVPVSGWYQNLKVKRNVPFFDCSVSIKEMKFKKYDNIEYQDYIEVPKSKMIPYDYYEPMGVPFTFAKKLNKEQFDVLGFLKSPVPKVNGKSKYTRLLIKRK